ncbi:MAG: carbamoyltransferase [Candidatus Woesearchaeota archaeon]|nr:carbamoyltransferase [Candidatus Woesearchaeota archaeon]
MHILGISCFYHDAAACIIKDGITVAAAQEERFTRKKHDISFPVNAINYCLKEAGISIHDVSYVGFYEKPILKFERVISQHLETFPKSYVTFLRTIPQWLTEKVRIETIIRRKTGYKGKILYIEHHIAHAASAFLVSPFKEAAILTEDGVGEWTTTSLGYGVGNDITLTKEIRFPHSIGLLYSAATAHLGFKVNNDEYKVMGLAAYGKPRYYRQFKELVDIKADGSYFMDLSYFDYLHSMHMPGKKYIQAFGAVRKKGEKVTQRHMDIAASVQKITEEMVIGMLNHLHKITKMENVCIAGGVALNSLANGKILSRTPFKRLFIQPAAGDDGTSMGCAFYIYNSLLKKKRRFVLDNCYYGPGFSDKEIKKFLDRNKITYHTFTSRKELLERTAKMISESSVIGWLQGRMEWGPRALGARSILADPRNKKMKEILNAKVKHREEFRPFAPVIVEEAAKDYFECDEPVPIPADFMLMVYPIRKEKQKIIPAVTHLDGTGRLQTIRRHSNPLYYDLIKEFEKITGVPIIINTSFNIRGEPIVCTPEDGYKCMMGTGIDCLVMGKFLIMRDENPADMWDSEKSINE